MDKIVPTRRVWAAGGLGAILILAFGAWRFSKAEGEADRWRSCIGQAVAGCRLPTGYGPVSPCPPFQECRTTPPGVRYLSAPLRTREPKVWEYYDCAVIALDAAGRVQKVEVKRQYGAF